MQLTACRLEVQDLRRALTEQQSEQVHSLVREKTRVETSLVRKERMAHDAEVCFCFINRYVDVELVYSIFHCFNLAFFFSRPKLLSCLGRCWTTGRNWLSVSRS